MKTRDQIYEKEARGLLRDLSMYHCLTKEQILRLFPDKSRQMENILTYMEYHRRVWRDGERYYPSQEDQKVPERGLSAAIWVLIDFIEQAEFHSIGDYPTQIIFFAHHAIYEIVYAEPGREALITQLLYAAREQESNYLVIVEQVDQIDRINAPNIKGYCTVSKDGEVKYYQKE